MPVGSNPVEEKDAHSTGLRHNLNPQLRSATGVNLSHIWDALLHGTEGGYPAEIQLLYVACANPLNQYPNVNKGLRALQQPGFIVVHEQFLTPTARFADVVLPVSTHWERRDVMRPWMGGNYFFFTERALEPPEGCKSDLEICVELAGRLGLEGYSDRSEDDWLRQITLTTPDSAGAVSSYEDFKRGEIHSFGLTEPLVAFENEIRDPERYPFGTPSGRIEIYSQALAALGNPDIPPVPKFMPAWEGRDDPLAGRYPLQLLTYHVLNRAHSSFESASWLKEIQEDTIWISPKDAGPRRIKSGDSVKVFNERGELRTSAHVTERIMPGVVALGEGGWFAPDDRGVDRGACANVLTRDRPSPAGSLASNSCLVEVRKLEG
jgi:anaerobic dimethyl sulfoxide reductase subunit A